MVTPAKNDQFDHKFEIGREEKEARVRASNEEEKGRRIEALYQISTLVKEARTPKHQRKKLRLEAEKTDSVMGFNGQKTTLE